MNGQLQRVLTCFLALVVVPKAFAQPFSAGPAQLSPEAQARLDESNRVMQLARDFFKKGEYERALETLDPLMGIDRFLSTDRLYGDCLIRLGRVSQSIPILATYARGSSNPNTRATLYGYALAVCADLQQARKVWDWYVANTWGKDQEDFTDWPGTKTQSDLIARFALATAVDFSYGDEELGRTFYLEKAIKAAPRSAMVQLKYAAFNTYPASLDPKFYRERIKYVELAKEYATTEKTKEEAQRLWVYLAGTAYRLEDAERTRKRMGGG
jgi:hypothetical protein